MLHLREELSMILQIVCLVSFFAGIGIICIKYCILIVVVICAGIHLWILGQSDVSWSDRPEGKRTNFDYEVYMQDCLTLWGKGRTIIGIIASYCIRLCS